MKTLQSAMPSVAHTLIRHQYAMVAGRETPMIAAGVGNVSLVWLPALMDAAASFTRVALELAGRSQGVLSVYAVDPPGYGSSSLGEHERMPTFAERGSWIDALLDHLRGPFILVGNSSGAVIAAMAAAARKDVLGLALVGWCDWRLIGQPHTELLCPSTSGQLQHLLRIGWHRAPRPFPQTLAAQLSYAQRPDYREHVRSFSPEAFGEAFDRYDGPLALIAGTSDGIITPAMVQAVATHRPQARLHWMEQCGHYPHREQPGALTEILVQWIGEVLPSATPGAGRHRAADASTARSSSVERPPTPPLADHRIGSEHR